MDVEQMTGPIADHAEGPVWSASWLRWVDMMAGDILSLDARGCVERRSVGSPVAAVVRPHRNGGAITEWSAGSRSRSPTAAFISCLSCGRIRGSG
jgi:hypothetical protein